MKLDHTRLTPIPGTTKIVEVPDVERIVRTLKGCQNTLAGWMRRMDGYDDEALARAFRAAWDRPDTRAALVRRMAAYYAAEAAKYDDADLGDDPGKPNTAGC